MSHGGPNEAQQCVPPRRPKAASPRAVGDETSPAHYRRGRGRAAGRGWGLGAGTRAHLFSRRRVGTAGEGRGRADPGACVRRGARPRHSRPRPPQPREPPELRRRTGGAQSSSCPRPRRRGDVSVHTYTHSGGRGAQSGAQLSPCFRGLGEKAAGAIEPGPCLGRKLQQDGRDGENSPGFCLRVLFLFLFFTHFHSWRLKGTRSGAASSALGKWKSVFGDA